MITLCFRFDSQATRCNGFFPSLKELEIQLDHHSAMDFLEKCDKQFCKRIEKLWLNSKGILENQEGEPGAEQVSLQSLKT